jgi:hypothetical protein
MCTLIPDRSTVFIRCSPDRGPRTAADLRSAPWAASG